MSRPNFLTSDFWGRQFGWGIAVGDALKVVGVYWSLNRFVIFGYPGSEGFFQALWGWVVAAAVILGVVRGWPKLCVARLFGVGKNIEVEVVVGDLFEQAGALVVPANRQFESSYAAISVASVQGQFSRRFYDDENHLAGELANALRGTAAVGTDEKGRHIYRLGHVIRLAPRSHTAYWVALATLNANDVASATYDDLRRVLPSLWQYLRINGGMEDIAMPILGTGFSRISNHPHDVILEILRSFNAACRESRVTKKLVIVIHPDDFRKYKIDLARIERFLEYASEFDQPASVPSIGGGQEVVMTQAATAISHDQG